MAKKRHYSSMSGSQAMKEGAGMIHENRAAFCNLPTEVMQKQWPSGGYSRGNQKVADLFMGVQKQMDKDHSDFNKAFAPGKY